MKIKILRELVEHLYKKGICKKVIQEITKFDSKEWKRIQKEFKKSKKEFKKDLDKKY